MPRRYVMRSKEEKLAIVKRYLKGESAITLAAEYNCNDRQVQKWALFYLAEGEAGLEVQKRSGNPLSRYELRKELTYEEKLQYQIELLKRELVKKRLRIPSRSYKVSFVLSQLEFDGNQQNEKSI